MSFLNKPLGNKDKIFVLRENAIHLAIPIEIRDEEKSKCP
jgi:hypothetical protein